MDQRRRYSCGRRRPSRRPGDLPASSAPLNRQRCRDWRCTRPSPCRRPCAPPHRPDACPSGPHAPPCSSARQPPWTQPEKAHPHAAARQPRRNRQPDPEHCQPPPARHGRQRPLGAHSAHQLAMASVTNPTLCSIHRRHCRNHPGRIARHRHPRRQNHSPRRNHHRQNLKQLKRHHRSWRQSQTSPPACGPRKQPCLHRRRPLPHPKQHCPLFASFLSWRVSRFPMMRR